MITIDQLNIDFRMEKEAFARELYAGWNSFYSQSIEKVFNDTLLPFDNEDEVILIDSLEIVLDPISEAEFHIKFPHNLSQKLKEKFTELLYKKDDPFQSNIKVVSTQHNHTDILFYFLLYGYLPINKPAIPGNQVDYLWKSVTQSDDQSIVNKIRHHWGQNTFRERLVVQTKDVYLQKIVHLIQPEEQEFIKNVRINTIEGPSYSKLGFIPRSDHRIVVWIFILSYLVKENLNIFNRKHFVKTLISELSAHYNIDELFIYEAIIEEVRPVPSSGIKFEWLNILEELVAERNEMTLNTQSGQGNHIQSSVKEEKRIEKTLKEKSRYEPVDEYRKDKRTDEYRKDERTDEYRRYEPIDGYRKDKRSDEDINKHPFRTKDNNEFATHNNTMGELIEINKMNNTNKTNEMSKLQQAPESGRIEVKNAGIALAFPFLPTLFRELGLLHNNVFTNDSCRIRAVFILQYLVTGKEEEEYSEYELVLNKVLTDSLELPLPLSLQLTEEEKSICVSMLNGLKANWIKLKNSSIEALREGFFQRNGILEKKEDSWELTVEEKSYDILLDTVPWNFRMTKFRWMNQLLNVKWR